MERRAKLSWLENGTKQSKARLSGLKCGLEKPDEESELPIHGSTHYDDGLRRLDETDNPLESTLDEILIKRHTSLAMETTLSPSLESNSGIWNGIWNMFFGPKTQRWDQQDHSAPKMRKKK